MIDAKDIQAIKNLIYTYASYVDRAEYEALGNMFEKGAIRANRGEDGEALVGSDQVYAHYSGTNKIHESGLPQTHHIVTNVIIDPNQSRSSKVRADSCYLVLQATPRLPLQPIVAGRYTDLFSCENGTWHYVEKFIYVDLVGDIREHLNMEL